MTRDLLTHMDNAARLSNATGDRLTQAAESGQVTGATIARAQEATLSVFASLLVAGVELERAGVSA